MCYMAGFELLGGLVLGVVTRVLGFRAQGFSPDASDFCSLSQQSSLYLFSGPGDECLELGPKRSTPDYQKS